MSDSIFHRIFSSPDIIPTHIFILFYFCEWVSVCLSLFICYFTLFPFTLSSFTAPFVSGSTFLAFEKRFSLCLRSPVQTTSLLYLFDIFFFFIRLLCWIVEQWRMYASQTKHNAHKRPRNGMLCEIFIWKRARKMKSVRNGIGIILNVVQRVKVRDDI